MDEQNMVLKRVLIVMIMALWLISFIQIFSVPPYVGDIFFIYKSGYFRELERNMYIVIDSFLHIKTMSKAEYAWIFLNDLKERYGMEIHVYDVNGRLVKAPGWYHDVQNPTLRDLIADVDPKPLFFVKGKQYKGFIPIYRRNECNFCHKPSHHPILGVFVFSMPFDGYIYYTSERVIIFSIITCALTILLLIVIRWNPYKDIQQLFGK